MHRVVLYYQPAVAVVVTLFVLVSELYEELAEPLADLHHEGYRAVEDVGLHLCYDGNGGKLAQLGGVVLSLFVVDA